jgi:hypothetical protein
MTRFAALAIAAVFCATAAAAAPVFSPTSSTGWYAYSRLFIPPPSGPEPVRPDPAHPLVSNDEFRESGKQPTFPMGDPESAILQPWAADSIRKNNARILAGKPAYSMHATCRPTGVPMFHLIPMTIPMYIVQGRREVLLILEDFADVRHIYLSDKHRPNPKPSWYGDSIGHYEGDTLVVDTIGFNTKTVLDVYRTPHTEKLHVVERWRTINKGKELEVTITVDDPDTFYQPWTTRVRDQREPEPFLEVVCAENNLNFGLFDFDMPVATKPDF